MNKFEFISHTADIRIKAEADTPEELFGVSLFALCSVIVEKPEKKYDTSIDISIESTDMTALLIDFLSEALFLMHDNKAIFHSARFNLLSDTKIDCTVIGYSIDGFDEDVKAITYHEADIKCNAYGLLETIIVLDI